MRRFAPILAATLLTCLLISGCAKLPSKAPSDSSLDLAAGELRDAIPLDYGDLVSVTTSEVHPGWAQLWFQREDRSVVAVYVQFGQRRLAPRALTIPRS